MLLTQFYLENKQMFPANMANFPTIGMSSEMTSSAYLQFNHVQQLLQCSGLESSGISSPDSTLLRRSFSTPVSVPETFADTSCFTVIFSTLLNLLLNQQILAKFDGRLCILLQQVQPPTTWDADMQNLFNVEFHQGRTAPFPSQPLFTGRYN